jgi:large subunit ribosomal protein L32
MPVPKYRTSKSKSNMRRSHHALKAPGLCVCSNCKEVKRPHIACGSCGHYSGKQVIEPKADMGWDASGVDFDTNA